MIFLPAQTLKKAQYNLYKYRKSFKLQTRTTSFSCSDDEQDYDESFLMSRPLPWVVRVFFESENSMKGTICSGT